MHNRDRWAQIKEYSEFLLIAIPATIVAILYPLNILSQEVAISCIIALLVFLALNEVIDRRKSFAGLEELIKNGNTSIIDSLQGIEVMVFTDEKEAYQNLTNKLSQAKSKIKYASLGSGHEKIFDYALRYNSEKMKIVKKGKIEYYYLTNINNKIRQERIQKELFEIKNEKYYIRTFEFPSDFLPMVSFTVIDDKYVSIGGHRCMSDPNRKIGSAMIRNDSVAELFSNYFDLLWDKASSVHQETANMQP